MKQQTASDTDRQTFSIAEFCKWAGITTRMFWRLDRRGEAPPTIRIGRRRFVHRETATTWLRARES